MNDLTYDQRMEKNIHILGLIKTEPAWALSRILLAEDLEVERDELRAALEEIEDGTTPDRIGRYDLLRDWVNKTARRALESRLDE